MRALAAAPPVVLFARSGTGWRVVHGVGCVPLPLLHPDSMAAPQR